MTNSKAIVRRSDDADAVTQRIVALDSEARMLAQEVGVPHTDFELGSSRPWSRLVQAEGALATVGAALIATSVDADYVSLMKHGGQWQLVYHRRPSVVSEATNPRVPLRDAPLTVRETFLKRSREFFATYLSRTSSLRQQRAEAVSAADETIAMLRKRGGEVDRAAAVEWVLSRPRWERVENSLEIRAEPDDREPYEVPLIGIRDADAALLAVAHVARKSWAEGYMVADLADLLREHLASIR